MIAKAGSVHQAGSTICDAENIPIGISIVAR